MTQRPHRRVDFTWRTDNRAALVAVCLLAAAPGAASRSGRVEADPLPAVDQARAHAVDERIDPNTASAASLQRLDNVGPIKAKAIVDYSRRHGPGAFRTSEDFLKVKGLGPSFYQRNQDHVLLPSTPNQ